MSNDDLKWLVDKLEQVGDKQDTTTEVLTRLVVSLDGYAERISNIESELKPIKAHVQLVNAGVKLLTVGGTIVMGAHSLGLF